MPRRIAPFTALIAAALLIGGVAYAVTPDTTAATDDVVTSTTDATSTTNPSITETTAVATSSTTVDTTSTTVDTTSTTIGTTSTTVGTTSTTLAAAAATTTSTVGATAGTRSFEAPGIGTLTVSFDGSTLALVSVQPAVGWTYTTDEITTRNVEIDFWKDGVRHRAKVEIEDGDLRFEHFEK